MYDNTTEALQDLMNRGFLIYEDTNDKTWSIQKIPTSLDPRPQVQLGGDAVHVFGSIESRDQAIALATTLAHQEREIDYVVEVQFNDGLGPKFKTLSTVRAGSVESAEDSARSLAESFFSGKPHVKSWDSRVRPASLVEKHWN